ncbi:MAG: HAMP domain-containing histidine kinase [Candidatus Obscuribacterales bacterium]|nr:HAMP domain-containing histidine kinase [Candidatus Obscuribacterales bacterium]
MTGQEKQSQPEISEMQTEIIERLEQTVASSSERIRKILANIPLSLVIANNKGVIEAVNERALASLDYKVQDLVERELGFLFEDAGAILVEDQTKLESFAKRRGGEHFPCEIYPSLVTMGSESKVFVHFQDITERHRLNELRRQFLEMVSHDLRNPIISLTGFVEMLEEGAYGQLSERGQAASQRARSTADYLLRAVNDLLDAEKLEHGEEDLHRSSVDLKKLLVGIVEEWRSKAGESGVEIELDCEANSLDLDANRVCQVFTNLIANAIEYSSAGGRISIAARVENGLCMVTVADQGPGIPEHLLEKIFERYYQGPRKSGDRRGFGLGLTIAGHICEQHGGVLTAANRQEGGAIFRAEFPVVT